ncbi:dTDP-4-dehydrorhamnose reductase [Patescibacteria group bacterium]|nr:dTDP-4-dehydrorhamnose reductase [Patescibacteria group bacterium]
MQNLLNKPNDKVLLLGVLGMLGSDLALVLADLPGLVLWDKEQIDVTNQAEVLLKIKELKPKIIINATGYTDVLGAEDNHTAADSLNDRAVGYLADSAKLLDAWLVHFSTEYVFDGLTEAAGYDESARPKPLNYYGQSKMAGEKHILNYQNGFLIRTSWLYGRTPQRGKPRGLNFIATILQKAQQQKNLQVVNDQFGKPTYTVDLANAVRKLLSNGYEPGIYHLVNEQATSWYELAREIGRLRGLKNSLQPVASADYPDLVVRPKKAILLNTKFPHLRPWQEAVKEYLQTTL